MRNAFRLTALATVVATTGLLASSAQAQVPEFITDCDSRATFCTETTVQSGYMELSNTIVDIPEGAIKLRAGIAPAVPGETEVPFYPPPSGDMLITEPIDTGILGIDARAELVDPAKLSLDLDSGASTDTITLPMVLHLESPLVGPLCRIGTDLFQSIDPELTTGTTSPPQGVSPMEGHLPTGYREEQFPGGSYSVFENEKRVDNAFAVPPAALCGFPPGILDLIVSVALNIPAAPGESEMVINSDQAAVFQ